VGKCQVRYPPVRKRNTPPPIPFKIKKYQFFKKNQIEKFHRLDTQLGGKNI